MQIGACVRSYSREQTLLHTQMSYFALDLDQVHISRFAYIQVLLICKSYHVRAKSNVSISEIRSY